MTKELKTVEGELLNISLNKKKIVQGWLLLITTNEEEYLIQQNFLLAGFKQYTFNRKIYKSNKSLKEFAISGEEVINQAKQESEKNYLGIAIAIPIGALLRNILPVEWLWGKSNLPINFLTGMFNLSYFWLVLMLSFYLISYYRKKRFESNLKKIGGDLVRIGEGYAKSPLRITQKILKWW
ncbi:hypothetical protein [Candidatus Enterococcus mansonii]|uniref:Uncharacterized protein n=1 Tax=Candidatus Enterococcus mansonii TaxID=1834181 RepID=A0A242CDY2_9ENTE|nr:hypothetical protein [Enterococcus sp. 4G2_DIV0659]OTO08416.1 hypothetical protein A5880_001416 [Enterococcus sp. 4G2_DIV0659]